MFQGSSYQPFTCRKDPSQKVDEKTSVQKLREKKFHYKHYVLISCIFPQNFLTCWDVVNESIFLKNTCGCGCGCGPNFEPQLGVWWKPYRTFYTILRIIGIGQNGFLKHWKFLDFDIFLVKFAVKFCILRKRNRVLQISVLWGLGKCVLGPQIRI